MNKEDLIKKYIYALRKGKGHEWIDEHGYDLDKNDLIRIIKELDYAIGDGVLCPAAVYKDAANELENWYFD